MPFDSTPENGLTMADLAWRLRNRDTWPPGFKWDYRQCSSCAMGLAWMLAGQDIAVFDPTMNRTAAKLTIGVLKDIKPKDHPALYDIFLRLSAIKDVLPGQIQPEDVADAIDQHLRSTRRKVKA